MLSSASDILLVKEFQLQGLDNNDNLIQILYLFESKNVNMTKHLQEQVERKYTHHDIHGL